MQSTQQIVEATEKPLSLKLELDLQASAVTLAQAMASFSRTTAREHVKERDKRMCAIMVGLPMLGINTGTHVGRFIRLFVTFYFLFFSMNVINIVPGLLPS